MYRDTAWTYWQYYIDLLYHRRRSRRAAVHHFRVSLTRTFWPPKSSLKHQKQTSASPPRTVEWNIVNAAHQCFNPPFFLLFFFFFLLTSGGFPGRCFAWRHTEEHGAWQTIHTHPAPHLREADWRVVYTQQPVMTGKSNLTWTQRFLGGFVKATPRGKIKKKKQKGSAATGP